MFVVYFLDYTLGSAWWVMVLYLIQVLNWHSIVYCILHCKLALHNKL